MSTILKCGPNRKTAGIINSTIPNTYNLRRVPRAAIRFTDLPYTTYLHLRKAFRHEIGLPDDALMNDARRTVEQAKTAYNGSRGREYNKPYRHTISFAKDDGW
jgi:hypothetical protein